jgi:imidazolonepropionase-like amidohydrolase
LINFVEYSGAAVDEALRLLTVNPATMTGFDGEAGSLEVGRTANLVAVDTAGRLVASVLGGRLAL